MNPPPEEESEDDEEEEEEYDADRQNRYFEKYRVKAKASPKDGIPQPPKGGQPPNGDQPVKGGKK